MRTHDEIIEEVAACAQEVEPWPSRRGSHESGLSRQNAVAAFCECTGGIVEEHRTRAPAQFAAGAVTEWPTVFAYEPIERHSTFFAQHLERRGDERASQRPYDQMGVAFPSVARLIPPLLLGRAVATGDITVRAFEPVILVRKPRDASPRPHLHTGKAGCGGTLNSLALVAHCIRDGAARCVVVGSRPLTRYQDLELSVPLVLRDLLADLNAAAFALRTTPGEDALARAPVVCDLLAGGGPHSRGNHNATNTELVPARTDAILSVIHKQYPASGRRRWPSRVAVLRLPTEPLPGTGPRRVAPNGLEPPGPGWSPDPNALAAEVAAAGSVDRESVAGPPPAGTAYRMKLPGADWCYIPAWLTRIGRSVPVTLLSRRSNDGAASTVWLTLGDPGAAQAGAIDAFRSSRAWAPAPRARLDAPFDSWVMRAYRRSAAGDLLVKGGAGEDLLAGVSAAMTAAFVLFAVEYEDPVEDSPASRSH